MSKMYDFLHSLVGTVKRIETESETAYNMTSDLLNVTNELKSDLDYKTKALKRVTLEDGKATFLGYAKFENGTLSKGTFYNSVKYCVATDDIISFDEDLEVSVVSGFEFGIHYFENGVFTSDSGWQLSTYTIPKGNHFKIVIARVQNDTSEIADIEEFVNTVTIETFLDKKIHEVNVNANKLDSKVLMLENNLYNSFDVSEVEDAIVKSYNADTTIGITYTNGKVFTGGDYDSYCYTQKILVTEGDVITLDTDYDSKCAIRYICAFNENSAVSSSGTQNVREYTVPNGIDGVIISYNNQWANGIIRVMSKITATVYLPNGNNIALKKWVHCGDSFSHYTNKTFEDGIFTSKAKTFPRLIADRNRMYLNEAFMLSGRTMAYPSDGTFTNSLTCPTADCYYQNIPEDTDYITIMLGINDSNHIGSGTTSDGEDATGVITLGTIDDTDTSTYCGAYNTVLSWLRENRPFAHVGIIVTNGTESEEYTNAQIALAKKWGYPFINLNGDDRTPAFTRCWNSNMPTVLKESLKQVQGINYPSDTHPNWETHELESTVIENFLRNL